MGRAGVIAGDMAGGLTDAEAKVGPIQGLGQNLHQNQVSVAIHDQSWQLVGFAEDQAAGIRPLLEHAGPELNSLPQALFE